jgi:hypothetical protein
LVTDFELQKIIEFMRFNLKNNTTIEVEI